MDVFQLVTSRTPLKTTEKSIDKPTTPCTAGVVKLVGLNSNSKMIGEVYFHGSTSLHRFLSIFFVAFFYDCFVFQFHPSFNSMNHMWAENLWRYKANWTDLRPWCVCVHTERIHFSVWLSSKTLCYFFQVNRFRRIFNCMDLYLAIGFRGRWCE